MARVPNAPILDYPTPGVILDTILVERTSNTPGNYTATEPGAPFSNRTHSAAQFTHFGANEFLGQKAGQDDEWLSQYWGRVPSTQDVVNWEVSYSAELNASPIFQRRYLEKRDGYTPRTKGQPLAGLYRIALSAAGSGFTSPPTISFTGGTGSGASAIAILDNSGGLAKITLKAEGTYTVVPTVVVTGGGGSGAAATAIIQPATCVLVKEAATNNAPEPFNALYLVVTRIYETLPGPELIKPGYDEETGARMRTVRQPAAVTPTLIARGAVRVFDGVTMYCVDSYFQSTDTVKGELVTVYMEKPPTRVELSSEKSVCPALMVFITGWSIPNPPFNTQGPYAGVNFTQTAKRVAVSVEEEISYTVGPSGVALPSLWNVISPGAASRFFPISGDTIHNAIMLTESNGMSTQTIEDLPASTPTSYTPGQDMIIHASEKPWKYTVFSEKRISTATEPT